MPSTTCFAGHTNQEGQPAQVNCVVSPSSKTHSNYSFASCDNAGLVCIWDARCSTTTSNSSSTTTTTTSAAASSSSSSAPSSLAAVASSYPFTTGPDLIDVMEIRLFGEDSKYTLALSDDYVSVVDWRNPTKCVWERSVAFLVPNSNEDTTFSTALCMNSERNNGDILVFDSDGCISRVESLTGKLISSNVKKEEGEKGEKEETEKSDPREKLQLSCGASKFYSPLGSSSSSSVLSSFPSFSQVNERFVISATTLGFLNLIDLGNNNKNKFSVFGSIKVGGLIDEDYYQGGGEEQQKQQQAQLSNPPLLSSLDCVFLKNASTLGENEEEEEGEDQDQGEEESTAAATRLASSLKMLALTSRADGVVTFSLIQPTSYPSVSRIVDLDALELGNQICSANFVSFCPKEQEHPQVIDVAEFNNNVLVSVVGANGVVALWSVSTSSLLSSSSSSSSSQNNGEEQEEEEKEEEQQQDSSVLLEKMNLREGNLGFNELQKQSGKEATMNCSCVLRSSSEPTIIVGDTAGRIILANLL